MLISDWEYCYKKGEYKIIPNRKIEVPAFLVKYFSLTNYNIEALKENYLYFSHPLILNDPFDSCLQLIDLEKFSQYQYFKLISENIRFTIPKEKRPVEELKSNVEKFYKTDKNGLKNVALTFYWNMLFKDYGILSLSSVDNDLLMWSYYTNHEGYQIKLKSDLFSNKEPIGPFPINYSDKYMTIYPRSLSIEEEYLIYLINIKSKQWKHEKEWRYIVNRENMSIPDYKDEILKDERRKVKFNNKSIDSIILGYKFFKGIKSDRFIKKNKVSYVFQKNENNDQNKSDKLKTDLLDFIINKGIPAKQIEIKEDNTFNLTPTIVNIECQNKNYKYTVETQR